MDEDGDGHGNRFQGGQQQNNQGGSAGAEPERPDDPISPDIPRPLDYSNMLGRCWSTPGEGMRCAGPHAAVLSAPDPGDRLIPLDKEEKQKARDQFEGAYELLKFGACDPSLPFLGLPGRALCFAAKVAEEVAKIQSTASQRFDEVPWVKQSPGLQPSNQACHVNPELDPVDKGIWSKSYQYKR